MNIDISSFCLGFVCPFALSFIIYLIINRLRHRCKHNGCKCSTVSIYRLLHMHNIRITVDGLSTYAIFKFQACNNGHVIPSMRVKMFTADQIRSKSQDEFDWNSNFINNICLLARIENPGIDYLQNQFNNPNPTPRILQVPTTRIFSTIKQKCSN